MKKIYYVLVYVLVTLGLGIFATFLLPGCDRSSLPKMGVTEEVKGDTLIMYRRDGNILRVKKILGKDSIYSSFEKFYINQKSNLQLEYRNVSSKEKGNEYEIEENESLILTVRKWEVDSDDFHREFEESKSLAKSSGKVDITTYMKEISNGELKLYKDGKLVEVKKGEVTTTYFETGGVKSVSTPNSSVEYYSNGKIARSEKTSLKKGKEVTTTEYFYKN